MNNDNLIDYADLKLERVQRSLEREANYLRSLCMTTDANELMRLSFDIGRARMYACECGMSEARYSDVAADLYATYGDF